jgi:hypothetical protein
MKLRILTINNTSYSVNLMMIFVNNNVKIISEKIKINKKLINQLKDNTWRDVNNKKISAMNVLRDKNVSILDYERIIKADLRYSIMTTTGPNYWILDGQHRLAKAFLLKKNIQEHISLMMNF